MRILYFWLWHVFGVATATVFIPATNCSQFECSSAADCAARFPCPYRYHQDNHTVTRPDPTRGYTPYECKSMARCGLAHTDPNFGLMHSELKTIGEDWKPGEVFHVERAVIAGSGAVLTNVTCPVFKVRSGTVRDVAIVCNNRQPAIVLDPGGLDGTVTVHNVRVPAMRTLLSGVHPTGVSIAGLEISGGSTGVVVLANFNPKNEIRIICERRADMLVVVKQTVGSVDVVNCSEIQLQSIVGILGTQYEMDYLYRNAELDPIDHLYRLGLTVLAGAIGVAFVWTIGTNGKALRELLLQHKAAELKEVLTYFENPLFSRSLS